jgi:hypothetical protein
LPRRAGGNAGAYFGLAYVYANGGGSVSYSNYGVRLAFRQKGAIVFD